MHVIGTLNGMPKPANTYVSNPWAKRSLVSFLRSPYKERNRTPGEAGLQGLLGSLWMFASVSVEPRGKPL